MNERMYHLLDEGHVDVEPCFNTLIRHFIQPEYRLIRINESDESNALVRNMKRTERRLRKGKERKGR